LQISQTASDCLEGLLTFDARECRTEAKMSSISEGEVPVIGPSNVEAIGIREAIWIAIRSGHHSHHSLSFPYGSPT
jgi:hypothetical protein